MQKSKQKATEKQTKSNGQKKPRFCLFVAKKNKKQRAKKTTFLFIRR
jgi:hypothetical protein